jgi:hypothetical protein
MSDMMLSVYDFEAYFNKLLSTANEVTLEIAEQKNVDPSRLRKSMDEIDDAIYQALALCDSKNKLNLTVQTKDGLDNLVQVLDSTYELLNKVYTQKVN